MATNDGFNMMAYNIYLGTGYISSIYLGGNAIYYGGELTELRTTVFKYDSTVSNTDTSKLIDTSGNGWELYFVDTTTWELKPITYVNGQPYFDGSYTASENPITVLTNYTGDWDISIKFTQTQLPTQNTILLNFCDDSWHNGICVSVKPTGKLEAYFNTGTESYYLDEWYSIGDFSVTVGVEHYLELKRRGNVYLVYMDTILKGEFSFANSEMNFNSTNMTIGWKNFMYLREFTIEKIVPPDSGISTNNLVYYLDGRDFCSSDIWTPRVGNSSIQFNDIPTKEGNSVKLSSNSRGGVNNSLLYPLPNSFTYECYIKEVGQYNTWGGLVTCSLDYSPYNGIEISHEGAENGGTNKTYIACKLSNINEFRSDIIVTLDSPKSIFAQITYENSVAKLYIDGILRDSCTIEKLGDNIIAPLQLGYGSWGYSNPTISSFRFYNRALTEGELYNNLTHDYAIYGGVFDNNLFIPANATQGKEFVGNGYEIADNSTWFVSDYIPIYPYMVSKSGATSGQTIIFYDNNKNPIGYNSYSATSKFVPPSSAKYFRINGLISEMNSIVITYLTPATIPTGTTNLFNINGNISQTIRAGREHSIPNTIVNGKLSANNYSFGYYGAGQKITVKANTTYTVIADVENVGLNPSNCAYLDIDNSTSLLYNAGYLIDGRQAYSFNTGSSTEILMAFSVDGNGSVIPLFSNIMLLEGDYANNPYMSFIPFV